MYSFHKVRDQKYRYEFRYPFFKQNNYDDLKYIRRKCVKLSTKKDAKNKLNKNFFLNEKRIYAKTFALKEILEMTVKQNTILVDINNQMTEEMKSIEESFKSKVKNLMGLMIEIFRNPESDLTINFKSYNEEMKKEHLHLDAIASRSTYFHSFLLDIDYGNRNLDLMSVIDKLNTFYENFKTQTFMPSPSNEVAINQLDTDMVILQTNYSLDLYSIPSPVNNFSYVSETYVPFFLANGINHTNSPLVLSNILSSPTDNPPSYRKDHTLVDAQSGLFFTDIYENEYCLSDYDDFLIIR